MRYSSTNAFPIKRSQLLSTFIRTALAVRSFVAQLRKRSYWRARSTTFYLAGFRWIFSRLMWKGQTYLVLAGAKQLFVDAPPRVVAIEVTSCVSEIREFLLSYGYRLYSFDGDRSALIEIEQPVFNTYAVRDGVQHEMSNFSFLPLRSRPLVEDRALAAQRAG